MPRGRIGQRWEATRAPGGVTEQGAGPVGPALCLFGSCWVPKAINPSLSTHLFEVVRLT